MAGLLGRMSAGKQRTIFMATSEPPSLTPDARSTSVIACMGTDDTASAVNQPRPYLRVIRARSITSSPASSW